MKMVDIDFDLSEFNLTVDICRTIIYDKNAPNKTLFLSDQALIIDFPVNKFNFGNNSSVISYNQSTISYSKGKVKVFGLGVQKINFYPTLIN